MSKHERIAAAALVAACAVFAFVLWSRDAAPRPAAVRQPPPTLRADTPLLTLPGIEERAAVVPEAVICVAKAGEKAAIRRADRLPSGVLYLDVKVSPTCYGWVRVDALVGVAPGVIYRY